MDENSLRVGILTGHRRAFCVGADLKVDLEWSTHVSDTMSSHTPMPVTFGGLTRRKGKKPVLGAVNGLCLGGGAEMIINSDMVIAASRVVFALPEVKRGVVALAGALPRLVRTVGKQRAMEIVLIGRLLTAKEAEKWGLVNEVMEVESGITDEEVCQKVVARALQVAREIAGNSPDAVTVSREGVKLGWEGVGVDEAMAIFNDTWVEKLYRGENIKEGLAAFVEKRRPVWLDSKL
ncbi:Crotonase core [Penicillium alfredii]|uniref:Crotonase core n=1 Tax=Penicillium alfredii TaxID=1506179 RepID=A0A9W9GA73_9EURO|nr:Crotonase core [Penicillium alfredii]KAJ5114921.1 Crotonase core [Penicillium alfredii]